MVLRSINSRGYRNKGEEKHQQEGNRLNKALADDSAVGSPSSLADFPGNHTAQHTCFRLEGPWPLGLSIFIV